jgi:exosome complex component RRP42
MHRDHSSSSTSSSHSLIIIMSSCLLSSSERLYILQGCRDNCRLDGRRRDEFRPYHQFGTISHNNKNGSNKSSSSSMLLPLCNGSARVFTMDHATDILATVKAELVHPAPHTFRQGTIELSVDHAPTGQQPSQQRHYCDQLQSLLSHLFIPYCMDLASLCLVPGMYVWKLHVDVWIVSSSGGSMVDAASRVIKAALMDTQLPHVELLSSSSSTTTSKLSPSTSTFLPPPTTTASSAVDWMVDGDMAHAHGLEAVQSQAPTVMTISVLPPPLPPLSSSTTTINNSNHSLVLDTTLLEEACAICQVHVSIDPQGAICATTMTSTTHSSSSSSTSSSLSLGMLQEITDLAMTHAMELHQRQQQQQLQEPYIPPLQPSTLQQQQQFSLLQPYFIIQ